MIDNTLPSWEHEPIKFIFSRNIGTIWGPSLFNMIEPHLSIRTFRRVLRNVLNGQESRPNMLALTSSLSCQVSPTFYPSLLVCSWIFAPSKEQTEKVKNLGQNDLNWRRTSNSCCFSVSVATLYRVWYTRFLEQTSTQACKVFFHGPQILLCYHKPQPVNLKNRQLMSWSIRLSFSSDEGLHEIDMASDKVWNQPLIQLSDSQVWTPSWRF